MDVPTLEEPLPISALQEGMWLLEQVEGEQPLVRSALKISGKVDAGRLARAIEAVVTRHELLRCGFRSIQGKVSRFHAQAARTRMLQVIDLRSVAFGNAQECVDFLRPYLQRLQLPLDAPPLMRLCLIRIDADTSVLWMAIHHVVCDEHSNNILCNEILTAYAGRPFSRPAGSFTDFLRRPDPSRSASESREFWRTVAAECDISSALSDMNGRCRTPGASKAMRAISATLSDEDESRVRQLCRVLHCTPAVLFLGVLQIWLARSSGGKAPPTCVPMQLRDDFEDDFLVGFLTNLIVVPTELSEGDTVATFFQKLSKRFYAGWSHRHTPFSEVGAFQTGQRRAPVHPLSRYLFVLETAPEVFAQVADLGLKIEALRTDAAIPGSEFAFIVTRGVEHTALRVQYDPTTIAAAWAGTALPRILDILRQLSAHPTGLIAGMRLRSAAKSASTPSQAPRRTVYERFRQVSRRLADRTAIYSTRPHSFAELDQRVDLFTGVLLRKGVSVGDLVGISLPRGADLVAVQLAILRLGAAYVPLSPDWSQAVMTQVASSLKCTVDDGSVDRSDRTATIPADFVEPVIPPIAIAYVLYTSGSTGEPKGVAIPHRALECYMDWSETYFGNPEDIVVCGCTPMIFDMSVSELLVPPCTGMKTLLVNRATEAYESPYWNEVTWITGVPTVLRGLLKATTLPESLRIVSFGGEELDRATVERVQRDAPAARVLNLYGPTEITVYATGADLTRGVVDPVPIGAPLRFHAVRIVDLALNELPEWAVGQLAVGGDCVALGYLNAPDTTSERFVPDPFAGPGARMHLTGDLAFRDDEGQIHLVGRIDSQEKILGVRVHLGGVEAMLRSHPEVADAACFVMNKGTATAYLAAALVGRTSQTPAPDAFRVWMQRVCAASHVPRQWAWFERLPTRPGGKVDRSALRAELESALRAKRDRDPTADEGAVLAVWSHVLEASLDDIDLNFFDAGGNSLHLPRLCLELQAIGLALQLQQVFEYPTVRAQAALLKLQRRAAQAEGPKLFDMAERRGELMRKRLAQMQAAGQD